MKHLLLATALGMTMTLPAVAQNIATVNGKPITQTEFDNTLKSLRIKDPSAEQRQAILNELINRDVLTQEAIKQGLDKKDEVKAGIEAARKDILIASLLQSWGEKNRVSDDELKKAYDTIVKEQQGKKEYKVRHILVKEEDKAKSLLADIKAKKISFSDAAKQNSIDPGANTTGGELGWANPDVFVPEFAQAVRAGKKGEISQPVKSQYGYHLIEIEDVRDVTPPTFEQVKNDLLRGLTQRRMVEYVESLRKKAKVDIKTK